MFYVFFFEVFHVLMIGFGAVLPSPHNDAVLTISETYSSVSRSSYVALPCVNFSRGCCTLASYLLCMVRTFHKTQCSFVKSRKNLATSTIHLSSVIATIPPEPTIAPTDFNVS